MAKKSKKSAVGLSLLALVLGVIIGSGGNFGVTAATYNEAANDKINENATKPQKPVTESVIYDNLQIHFLEYLILLFVFFYLLVDYYYYLFLHF